MVLLENKILDAELNRKRTGSLHYFKEEDEYIKQLVKLYK